MSAEQPPRAALFEFVVEDVFRLVDRGIAAVGTHPDDGAFTSGELVDVVRDGKVVLVAEGHYELHSRPGTLAIVITAGDADVRPGDVIRRSDVAAAVVERCEECGFDASESSDADAISLISELPGRWAEAIDGLTVEELRRRPVAEMWSIAEYTDHVREMIFGMRFVLDTALADTGTDLGDPPKPRFDPEPRTIDIQRALDGFTTELQLLAAALEALPPERWSAWLTLDGHRVDVGWIARHAVHDVTHHLGDVARLRQLLR